MLCRSSSDSEQLSELFIGGENVERTGLSEILQPCREAVQLSSCSGLCG